MRNTSVPCSPRSLQPSLGDRLHDYNREAHTLVSAGHLFVCPNTMYRRPATCQLLGDEYQRALVIGSALFTRRKRYLNK